ncbi:MAG TPA: hypothetical protein VGH81_07790 [Rudaea sp.]|jgi:hypothetical protein
MDDIAIIDLDLKKTTWSRVHSSMRTLYLKLSAEPDTDWIRFFREERESRVVIKRHGLWIEDGHIVFDCLLADVETHHLPDFRASIAYANTRYRELKAIRRKESRQRQGDARSEQEQLALLRSHIRDGDAGGERAGDIAGVAAPIGTINEDGNGAGSTSTGAPRDEAVRSSTFDTKRNELRARFRAALKSRTRESDRGND